MSDNTVTISGTLGRDPELRFTPSGAACCNFSMAVNKRYKRNDEWQEDTHWFDITCWRQLAENVAASLTKGSRVIVTGRLESREWEKDGQKRNKVEVLADEVAPSLRWATVIVERNERTTMSLKEVKAEFDPNEEPF